MDAAASLSIGETRSFLAGGSDRAPPRRPVFLHGMWRSGSTYLWSRFRTAPDTCCFYEPLHHGLAKLTQARIARDTPEQIDANRHPALSKPYYDEFAPLIERRGVRGFHASLAYERFILGPDEAHPRLERYIAGLIDHAVTQHHIPVLGFNRTGLRLAWLKARFDAVNIHIERDPMGIWASYAAEAAKGNYAFFSMWLSVLEKNAAQPLFAPLVDRLLLRPPPVSFARSKARHRRIVQAMSQEESYFLIYYLWLACTAHAVAECDLVIDTRMAAMDARRYSRQAAAEVARLTGVHVDLDALQVAEPRTELPSGLRGRIEHSVAAIFPREALPYAPGVNRRLDTLAPRTADRLAAAL